MIEDVGRQHQFVRAVPGDELGNALAHVGRIADHRTGQRLGDHSVVFAGEGERIELNHRGEDRSIFARGAVRAALWLARQPAGRYRMAEVLGL